MPAAFGWRGNRLRVVIVLTLPTRHASNQWSAEEWMDGWIDRWVLEERWGSLREMEILVWATGPCCRQGDDQRSSQSRTSKWRWGPLRRLFSRPVKQLFFAFEKQIKTIGYLVGFLSDLHQCTTSVIVSHSPSPTNISKTPNRPPPLVNGYSHSWPSEKIYSVLTKEK